MSLRDVEIERDILPILVKLQAGRRRQPLSKGGLAFKPVGNLSRFKHREGVGTRCLRKSRVQLQRSCSCLRPRLVGQLQKQLFRVPVVLMQRNVRSQCRGSLQRRVLERFRGRRLFSACSAARGQERA